MKIPFRKPRSFGVPGDDNYREIVKAIKAPDYRGPSHFVVLSGEELSPSRCREYAEWLLRAADWIEAHDEKSRPVPNKDRAYEEGIW